MYCLYFGLQVFTVRNTSFPELSTDLGIALIANSIEQNINHNIVYTSKQKLLMLAVSFCFVSTISIGSVLGGGYQLVASGKFRCEHFRIPN